MLKRDTIVIFNNLLVFTSNSDLSETTSKDELTILNTFLLYNEAQSETKEMVNLSEKEFNENDKETEENESINTFNILSSSQHFFTMISEDLSEKIKHK